MTRGEVAVKALKDDVMRGSDRLRMTHRISIYRLLEVSNFVRIGCAVLVSLASSHQELANSNYS